MRRGLAIVAGVLLGASACMAANYYRQMLMLPRAVASAPAYTTHADILIDFEAGTAGDTLTTNILDAATHTTRPLGAWVLGNGVPVDYPSDLTIQGGTNVYLHPFAVGNTNYASNGSRVFSAQTTNQAAMAVYTFNRTIGYGYSNVSFGAWLKVPSMPSGRSVDLFVFKKGSGFCALNLYNGKLCMETAGGVTTNDIAVSTNNYYWVTMLCPMSGDAKLSVYNADGSLVGTNYVGVGDTSNLYHEVWFGRTDSHGVFEPGFINIDNMAIDLTDASYPLGMTTDSVHSASFVDGYLLAEDFEDTGIPIGFSASGAGITWHTNVNIDGTNAMKIDQSSGIVSYDLGKNYTNVYTYEILQPDAVANYRYLNSFASPVGRYALVMSIAPNWQTRPYMGGAVGTPAGGMILTNGVTYHLWTEWEGGKTGKFYMATSPTKPATPTITGTIGGGAYTSSVVRFVMLNDGGKTYHDKFRVSTTAPIGSNPL